MNAVTTAGVLAAAILGAYALPAVVLWAIWPRIAASRFTVPNYRGVPVAPALWVVFPVWALGVTGFGLALNGLSAHAPATALSAVSGFWPAVAVALAALVFGVIDDVGGGNDAKGFRGHLSELARGRLTTGGLKTLGIGLVAFIAALATSVAESTALARTPGVPWLTTALSTLLGTLVIALSANAVNLADLRPGRALKVGFVLLILALSCVVFIGARPGTSPAGIARVAVVIAVILGGPMLAVWPYDLRERGMLGDGGANAFGALLGYAIFVALAPAAISGYAPAWVLLGVMTGLLVLVNGLSERVSYSALIERHSWLRWLDSLGRPSFEETGRPSRVDER